MKKQGKHLSGCRNYQRQKRRSAKIARKREDFRHKLSRQLVDSFDLIALEDLHVVGMLRNHHLAKVVSESAWSDFIHKVQYKAEWEGKTAVLVSQWFPSTRTCSCCGARAGLHGAGDLGVREWVCPECDARHDRDANTSWNILLEGLRIVASGDDEMVPCGVVCTSSCSSSTRRVLSLMGRWLLSQPSEPRRRHFRPPPRGQSSDGSSHYTCSREARLTNDCVIVILKPSRHMQMRFSVLHSLPRQGERKTRRWERTSQ